MFPSFKSFTYHLSCCQNPDKIDFIRSSLSPFLSQTFHGVGSFFCGVHVIYFRELSRRSPDKNPGRSVVKHILKHVFPKILSTDFAGTIIAATPGLTSYLVAGGPRHCLCSRHPTWPRRWWGRSDARLQTRSLRRSWTPALCPFPLPSKALHHLLRLNTVKKNDTREFVYSPIPILSLLSTSKIVSEFAVPLSSSVCLVGHVHCLRLMSHPVAVAIEAWEKIQPSPTCTLSTRAHHWEWDLNSYNNLNMHSMTVKVCVSTAVLGEL